MISRLIPSEAAFVIPVVIAAQIWGHHVDTVAARRSISGRPEEAADSKNFTSNSQIFVRSGLVPCNASRSIRSSLTFQAARIGWPIFFGSAVRSWTIGSKWSACIRRRTTSAAGSAGFAYTICDTATRP